MSNNDHCLANILNLKSQQFKKGKLNSQNISEVFKIFKKLLCVV